MKGQIWHCKKVKWILAEDGEKQLSDCLVLFICFENGDNKKQIINAIRRIEQLNKKRFQRKTIAIFPFSHFSSNVLSIDKAIILHEFFIDNIKNKFDLLEVMPFDKEKEVVLHLYPRNTDVSYFEYC
jgi:hypothetical protein